MKVSVKYFNLIIKWRFTSGYNLRNNINEQGGLFEKIRWMEKLLKMELNIFLLNIQVYIL